jgi:hypothetical protein
VWFRERERESVCVCVCDCGCHAASYSPLALSHLTQCALVSCVLERPLTDAGGQNVNKVNTKVVMRFKYVSQSRIARCP